MIGLGRGEGWGEEGLKEGLGGGGRGKEGGGEKKGRGWGEVEESGLVVGGAKVEEKEVEDWVGGGSSIRHLM